MRKEYDFSKGRRNPYAPLMKGKTRITIRLDDDIVAWFRQQVNDMGGGNYQTLINQALRRHMTSTSEPLEAVVRRVVRQELAGSPSRARRRRTQAA